MGPEKSEIWNGFFHLLKNMFVFPLLVLKGIYHYCKYVLNKKWKVFGVPW